MLSTSLSSERHVPGPDLFFRKGTEGTVLVLGASSFNGEGQTADNQRSCSQMMGAGVGCFWTSASREPVPGGLSKKPNLLR